MPKRAMQKHVSKNGPWSFKKNYKRGIKTEIIVDVIKTCWIPLHQSEEIAKN
tara:strand:- start:1019 stop:1174 length:156 start_codon:yes stop_codon:yes gene_type:complete